MVGWKSWVGKKVYIELLSRSHPYTGKVIDVDNTSGKPFIWITIIDKFGMSIKFLHSEVKLIQEER